MSSNHDVTLTPITIVLNDNPVHGENDGSDGSGNGEINQNVAINGLAPWYYQIFAVGMEILLRFLVLLTSRASILIRNVMFLPLD